MEEEKIIEDVTNFIENKRISDLRKYLENINSADFPSILENIDDEKIIMVYRLLSKEKAAEVFVELEHDDQERLINCLTDKEIKNVMNEIFMDDAVDLIEEMPSNVVKRILANTKLEDRKIINELLKYPDDTAGSLMTTEFIDLKENMTVEKAFEVIKQKGLQKETVYNCYVLATDRKLLGVLDIKDLLVAETNQLVKEIMDTNVIEVQTLEDQEEVSKMFDKYDLVAIPVVDKENRLVGIITIDDAIDVMQEETSEDFELMAGITSTTDDSYFKTSVVSHAKSRILWLLLLMLSATITGTITTYFESAISALPILVAFMPMLMDTGGNCGSQTSTLIIRGLATDEISSKDLLKVIWKEMRVALMVGVILGIVNGIRVAIQYQNFLIAIVVAITLVLVVLAAKLIGGILPIIAKKVKLDPALMASPIITTIVDIFSVTVFFTLASLILKI
jgi:magnesium transporter